METDKTRKGRNWNEEEEAYLEERWGQVSVPSIAQKLKRTPGAVIVKARRLHLGPALLAGEYISLSQLLQAVTGSGSSYSYKMVSWVKNRGLPVHTRRVNRNAFRVVYVDEFWDWAYRNRAFIDFSKMEPLALGAEPDWVAEQRRKDYKSGALQCKEPWTPAEDARLLELLSRQQYGYAELSERLHRSAGAIQRRCCDLGTKYRPVKAASHGAESVWSEEDYQTLADGIRAGDSYMVIGIRLGKSEKAVRGKVYVAYLTEKADKVREMLGDGRWGDGAPTPTVKQALALSHCRGSVKKDGATLAGLLKYRLNALGYDPYWQRFMCMHWDDFEGCSAGCADCDSCTAFKRIREQYCVRCGCTFFERKENRLCPDCRKARKKQAQRKWCALNKK